jgi:subtilisin family serine protease
MTWRRLIICLALMLALTVNASAAPVQVIVQLSQNSPLAGVIGLLNGILLDSIPEARLYLLQLPQVPVISPFISMITGILWVEPNAGVVQMPMGQLGILQKGLLNTPDWYRNQPAFQLIHAPQALEYSNGQGVVVADINSLIDYKHPALAGHLTGGYDFIASRPSSSAALNQSSSNFLDQSSSNFLDQSSSNFLDQSVNDGVLLSSNFLDTSMLPPFASNPAYGHGTLCAGVIAAVAPGAMIMPIRAFDENGGSDFFTLAKSIRYAASHGAQVINMSWGTLTNSKAIQSSIDFALQSDVTLIASAGNNDTSSPQYPASYSNVITVASTDLNDVKASFSNYGRTIEVDAPGVNIISAYPNGLYGMVSGTSFSAPMVAAEAALLRSNGTNQVTSPITSGTVNIDAYNPNYVGMLGTGRIDVLKTVHPY